jgi:hypothetical protein
MTIQIHLRTIDDLDPKMCEVYFSVDGRWFPGERWTDLRDAVRAWENDLDDDGKPDRLRFMDGPYSYSVNRVSDDLYKFSFFREYGGGDEDEVASTYVPSEEYVKFRECLRTFVRGIECGL